jgi:large subunit ribosomal protein L17
MRHLKSGRKLGRNATHRLALMRNLTMALIQHERIITTVEKAKEARSFAEKLITLAKKGTLHARRLVLARLGPPSNAKVNPEGDKDEDRRKVLEKLFEELAPRFRDRPGGYTRIVRRHERRLGDAGQTAFLELLKEGEVKVQTRKPAPAPAALPRVQEPEVPPTEQPAQPQAEAPSAAGPPGETPPSSSESASPSAEGSQQPPLP